MPDYFDLEKAIATWRHYFSRRQGFVREDLDELERTVRDHVRDAVRRGLGEEAAFREALDMVGGYEDAEAEYRKVYWGKLQRQRRRYPSATSSRMGPTLGDELERRLSMLHNYLKATLRNLLRKRGYSFINVAGLTLGMAGCLVILQYVAFEYGFDRFNEGAPSLYRVVQTTSKEGEAPAKQAMTGYALGPAAAQSVPEVVRYARVHPDFNDPIVANPAVPDRAFEETNVYYADPAFLQLFTYPLVAGDPATALAEPGTILLSETTARKYFGDDDPLGQTLGVAGWVEGTFRVTGVFRDVPAASHLRFDLLLPMADLLAQGDYSDPASGWSWNNFFTYVQLRADADLPAVERKLTDALLQHRGESFRARRITARLGVQPLADVHLNAEVMAPKVVMGSYRTVSFFTVVGLVTLLIALVNYVNLATARALDRAKEVGVRKVVGAQRGQLVAQFLCEAALTNGVALLLALVLAAALRPLVNDLAGVSLPATFWRSAWFWATLATTFAAGTLLAGLYPAFVLSSFRPAAVLKGKAGPVAAQRWLRRGLVVLQFAASVVLVVGTTTVFTQLRYMRQMDLGIDLEQVVTVPGPRMLADGTDNASAIAAFADELRKLPAVRALATSNSLPGQGFQWYTSSIRQATADPSTSVSGVATFIDTAFARVYGLELVAGKGFEGVSPQQPEGAPMAVIANETAVRALGFDTPAAALDQLVHVGGPEARIVGVFRDFHWSSAREARENAFFALTATGTQLSLKVQTADLPGTLAAVEGLYTRLFPGNPFRYAFLDDAFDAQYRNDERFATLFSVFAGLAVLIACLGLFGLASFTTQQRTKEIGIRKTLGASAAGLVVLLSTDFVKLVAVSIVLAAPVAYVLMRRWLDGFAYHVELGAGVFVLAGALALGIALLTVAYQSVRAAVADPVRSLRVE